MCKVLLARRQWIMCTLQIGDSKWAIGIWLSFLYSNIFFVSLENFRLIWYSQAPLDWQDLPSLWLEKILMLSLINKTTCPHTLCLLWYFLKIPLYCEAFTSLRNCGNFKKNYHPKPVVTFQAISLLREKTIRYFLKFWLFSSIFKFHVS